MRRCGRGPRRRSISPMASQHAAYPSASVARSPSTCWATTSGWSRRNAVGEPRAAMASATAAVPSARTRAARAYQASIGGRWAALHSTIRLSMRSDAWLASHMPTMPPSEVPQNDTDGRSRASSIRSTSRPRSAIEYGPGGTGERPCPRWSYRTTRCRAVSTSSCGPQSSRSFRGSSTAPGRTVQRPLHLVGDFNDHELRTYAKGRVTPMIYELRRYHLTTPPMAEHFNAHMSKMVPLFDEHDLSLVGAWDAVIGSDLPFHTYLLRWHDLGHREAAWASFYADQRFDVSARRDERAGRADGRAQPRHHNPAARDVLTAGSRDVRAPALVDGNLAATLEVLARDRGWLDRPLLRCGEGQYSFGEVLDRAARVATLLGERGVRPGDRVLLAAADSVGLATAFLGTLRMGAVAVTVNPGLTAGDQRDVALRRRSRPCGCGRGHRRPVRCRATASSSPRTSAGQPRAWPRRRRCHWAPTPRPTSSTRQVRPDGPRARCTGTPIR